MSRFGDLNYVPHMADAVTARPSEQSFYRPTPRFIASRTATGSALLLSPEVREMEEALDYHGARSAQRNKGEAILRGMLALGGAFRFIEKLYAGDAIDFQTRRSAGNLLCELYEDLRENVYMYEFSRSNPKNAGCL